MKKVFAFLLASVLLFSFSAAAFADNNVLNYGMIDKTVFEGSWFTVSEAVDMYLPVDWIEIDPEEFGEGVCFVYADKAREHMVMMQYMDPEDVAEMKVETMDELAQGLVLAGYKDAEVWEINELYSVVYTDESTDSINIMISTDDGGMLIISMLPQSDAAIQKTFFNIWASVSAPEA